MIKNKIQNLIKAESFITLVKFGLVGGLGTIVNLLILYLLTDIAGFHYLISAIFSIEMSVITNFLLHDAWTFKERKAISKRLYRFCKFHLTVMIGLVTNYAVLFFLTEFYNLYYLASAFIGILTGFIINFLFSSNFVWRGKK